MFWATISLDGHTYMFAFARGGIMAAINRSDILEPIVMPYAGSIGDAFILMQYIAFMCPHTDSLDVHDLPL